MKLIYISHLRFPSERTHSTFAMETCESFVSHGADVELWIPFRFNKSFRGQDPFRYHGVKSIFRIRRLPALDLVFIGGKWGHLVLMATFGISILLRVVFLGLRSKVIFYGHDPYDVFFLLKLRSRIFIEIHEIYPRYRRYLRHTKKLFSRINGLIVTNNFKKSVLEREFGVPGDRVLNRPNAVDVKLFMTGMPKDEARTRLKLPENKIIFLYTGHLFDWKGSQTLLGIHQFLSDNEILYIVGGTRSAKAAFEVRMAREGAQNVILTGERPHDEIPIWLRAADFLLIPHSGKFDIARFEASPVKLFEYMASGRPIVVSDLPSMREVVDDTMVWFCKPDSPESLVEAARYLGEHLFQANARAARAQKAVAEYSWDMRAEAILSFINRRIQ